MTYGRDQFSGHELGISGSGCATGSNVVVMEPRHESRSAQGARVQQGDNTSISAVDVNVDRRLWKNDRRIGFTERRAPQGRRHSPPYKRWRTAMIISWIKKKLLLKEAELMTSLEEEREDTDTRNRDLQAVFSETHRKLNSVLSHIDDQSKGKE